MKTLFVILAILFQLLGALQPVQSMVQMVMATGLVKDPQMVFICLSLAIIVFAGVVKFLPGAAGPFQRFEVWLKDFALGKSGSAQVTALTSQVQAIAADIALIKTMLAPVQDGTGQSTTDLDALATGQPATAVLPASAGSSQ